jgi:hypothetical protein
MDMIIVDEIEELRAELRSCQLTDQERKDAEIKLAELLRERDRGIAAQEGGD